MRFQSTSPTLRRSTSPIETLEARRLLAHVTWDGGGDGASWSDPLNWSDDALPQTDDNVGIHNASDGVILAEDATIRTLFVTSSLVIDGATLRVMEDISSDWTSIHLINGSVLHSSGESLLTSSVIVGAPGDTVPSRLVLSGSFGSFGRDGEIEFNAGSVLDLTGVSGSGASVSEHLLISGATIEAPAGFRFNGGNDSRMNDIITTGALQFIGLDVSGTISLGGDLTIVSISEVRSGIANDVIFKGEHVVHFYNEGSDEWSHFYGEFASNAEMRISQETEVRVHATGEFYSDGSGASILNLGKLIFDGSDADPSDEFQVKIDVINLGSIEVIDGAHVTFDHLIGNANEVSMSGPNTTLVLDGNYELNNMKVGAGTSLFLTESSWQREVSMDVNGTVIFDHDGNVSSFNFVKSMVQSGYAYGTWNGGGLRDSLAAADARTTLSYAASDVILGANGGMFGGFEVDSTAVIVHHTLDADFNLDGVVNFNDVLRIAQNYNTFGGKNFTDGDTNFDNGVNFPDLLRASQLYGQSIFSNSLVSKSSNRLDNQKRMTSHRSVIA